MAVEEQSSSFRTSDGTALFGLLPGGMTKRGRIIAGTLGAVAAGTLIVVAVASLVRYSGGVVRLAPWPVGRPAASAIENGPAADGRELRLAAPRERDDPDAGVAAAARQFAIRSIPANLTTPGSAEFPEDTIRFERLALLNQSTGGKIVHWAVEGDVDSRNDYGATVRTHWRMVVARADHFFFPVMATLEGFEIFRMPGHVESLAEARKAASQERAVQAAAQKAKERDANREVWKAIDDAKPPEEKAAAALKLAVSLLSAGRKEPAHKRLRELIDKFPDTNAAAEAAELLKQ